MPAAQVKPTVITYVGKACSLRPLSRRPQAAQEQQFGSKPLTIDTEIKVKLIPQKMFFAFAFVLILTGQMIFCIHAHIDTSP